MTRKRSKRGRVTNHFVIRPFWTDIESLKWVDNEDFRQNDSISAQNVQNQRVNGVSRYAVVVISYASLSSRRLLFADLLSVLRDNCPTRYLPKMGRYRITWWLDIQTKKCAVIGGASLSAGRLTGPPYMIHKQYRFNYLYLKSTGKWVDPFMGRTDSTLFSKYIRFWGDEYRGLSVYDFFAQSKSN